MARNEHNTPVIIKYPFWRMTAQNENAVYACINCGEAYAPDEKRSKGYTLFLCKEHAAELHFLDAAKLNVELEKLMIK